MNGIPITLAMKLKPDFENFLNSCPHEGLEFIYWEYDFRTDQLSFDGDLKEFLGQEFREENERGFGCFKNYMKPFQWQDFENSLNKLIKNKSPLDFKITLTFPQSGMKSLRVMSGPCDDENISCGYMQNITREVLKDYVYRNHNLELSAFEKGLEQFSIVARTDPRGRITFANEEFCRLSKFTHEELLGEDHRIVNSGYHPKEFFKHMWSEIKQGRNWRGLVKNKAKDGSFYWVDTIIIPILDTNRTLIEILSFRFDVTSNQELKEENKKLREELQMYKLRDMHPAPKSEDETVPS